MGISEEQLGKSNKSKDEKIEHELFGEKNYTKIKSYSKKNVIKKWRSVEKNVSAVLELMENISYVTDVSNQNLGYDLEAVLTDGTRRYYEVKSVKGLGEEISLTNNEYSTGSQYKNNYYLAIACQRDSDIEICFVKDPINSLSLNKRVTRWEWICNEYKGEIISTILSNESNRR